MISQPNIHSKNVFSEKMFEENKENKFISLHVDIEIN